MFWIPDETECWIPATCVDENIVKETIRVSLPGGRVVEIKRSNCIPISDPDRLDDAPDDLITLSEVNEASILNGMRKRFVDKNIYTACGSVLMVVNPFAKIDNLYGDEQINYYRDPYAEGLIPHIYIISSRAFTFMINSNKNQSILISGESGW